jgi:hypothetical protein
MGSNQNTAIVGGRSDRTTLRRTTSEECTRQTL